MKTRGLAGLLLVMVAAGFPAHARAEFPERTVKIVVPFDAGGTVDAVARALANRLNAKWNVPVIVENRPGAGNTIGAAAVAKAEPDGYTLLFANTSVSVNPSLFKSLPYDTLRDLAPVVYLSPSPNVLLVQKTLGVSSLNELIALAKTRPATPLSYASVGRGSAHHFCMELLKSEAGIELLHVPYRGVAPAVLAVTRGEVDLYCSDIPGALNLLRGRQGEAARDHQHKALSHLAGDSAVRRGRPAQLRRHRLRRHHGDRGHAARRRAQAQCLHQRGRARERICPEFRCLRL